MAYNPYNKYAAQSVMTMTNGEMLTRLYEAVILNMNLAIKGISQKDIAATNLSLQKAQKILNYLTVTLDRQYPISNNLAALYDFFNRQLITANVKKNSSLIEEIVPMVEELRDAFVQGDKLSRIENSPISAGSVRFAVTG
ncbi:MAG: flagellar export chaperone FliS [Candidatus Fimivivens sp.]